MGIRAEVIALLDRRSLRNRSADKGDFNHCRAILISQREDSGIGHPLAIDERVTGTSTPYPVTSAAQCADVLVKAPILGPHATRLRRAVEWQG